MMKKNRKAASLLLVSALACTLLAGCSGGGGKTTEAPKAETTKAGETTAAGVGAAAKATTTAAPVSTEPVTLRFVSWQTNHDAANQRVAEEYKKLHPNVTVQFDYVGDMNANEYLTKTDIMLMGGEAIDILMTSDFAKFSTRAVSGSYLQLDSFFEAEGVKPEDAYNVIIREDDKIYGIPGEIKYNLVLLNKDILDAAGLPIPPLDWTWDDYREYAKKLTSGSGADTKYGSYFHLWGNTSLWGVTSGKLGNSFFNDEETLTFGNPDFAKFLQFRYDMENTDKCSTPLADVKSLNMNYRDQFFNGNIAMLPMGTFMLSDIGNEKYSPKFVTTFARQPLWDKDGEHYNVAASTMFAIAKTSEHPQEAYDFLRFWTGEGVDIKGMFISNQKNADKMESVNKIVKNFKDKIDIKAIEAIMKDPKWVDSYEEFTPEFQTEIDSILTEETDKYYLGSQSLDDTIAKLLERGNEVIKENK